jgi:anionic cell wall polymer biosynthesis LytR-Cps2A-Psr (LCP) family protein
VTLDNAGTGLGRRAGLRAKRRRQRRRLVVAALASLVVLLVLVTVVLVRNGGGSDKSVSTPARTQKTVLLQVQAGDGSAFASALLAHDPARTSGVVVLVPPQVLANVPGVGSGPFGKALQTGQITGARNALSDLMSVTIDGSWVLDVASFTRLVDQVGGIDVTVDALVTSGRTVLLQPGEQHLGGGLALTYATYLGTGEQEQTRLTRLQSVLDAVVGGLPKDVTALLGSLGAGSRTNLSVSTLAEVLSGLKQDGAKQELQYRSLPVIPVDSGTETVRFRVDPAATRKLVDDLLAQSVPPGARTEGNRVLVLNGVGTPGLGEKVRAKLIPAGFVFVGSQNAPSFGHSRTQVLVRDATTAGAELGVRVAKALGVPAASVQSSTSIGTIADVVVIVGRDFKAK